MALIDLRDSSKLYKRSFQNSKYLGKFVMQYSTEICQWKNKIWEASLSYFLSMYFSFYQTEKKKKNQQKQNYLHLTKYTPIESSPINLARIEWGSFSKIISSQQNFNLGEFHIEKVIECTTPYKILDSSTSTINFWSVVLLRAYTRYIIDVNNIRILQTKFKSTKRIRLNL